MKRKPFTWEQAQALAERCPSVEHVSPYLFSPNTFGREVGSTAPSTTARDIYNIELAGTEEGYAEGGAQVMLTGRFFTDEENRRHQPVVVIGEHVYKALFQGDDPLGKWIDVDGHQFRGGGRDRANASVFPARRTSRVLLPYFTMHKMFPTRQGDHVRDHRQEGAGGSRHG